MQQQGPHTEMELEGALGGLQFFTLPECCARSSNKEARKSMMGRLKSLFNK